MVEVKVLRSFGVISGLGVTQGLGLVVYTWWVLPWQHAAGAQLSSLMGPGNMANL